MLFIIKQHIITCENWTGRRTLQGIGSSDVLLLFAVFYGLAFSWQCSSVFGSRSKTFLTLHLRTEKKNRSFIIILAKAFELYNTHHAASMVWYRIKIFVIAQRINSFSSFILKYSGPGNTLHVIKRWLDISKIKISPRQSSRHLLFSSACWSCLWSLR